MAAVPPPVVESPWPPDVAAFAAEHGVAECLPRLVEATRQIFPTAQPLRVYLEDDPEIADDWHIMIDVTVRGLGVEEAFQARQQWNHALFRWCPSNEVCTFRLRLDLQD
jgi:hypothetical protein